MPRGLWICFAFARFDALVRVVESPTPTKHLFFRFAIVGSDALIAPITLDIYPGMRGDVGVAPYKVRSKSNDIPLFRISHLIKHITPRTKIVGVEYKGLVVVGKKHKTICLFASFYKHALLQRIRTDVG